ncbi:MAG TPA: ribonuclease Y [Candidatus Polarisedimenticolia bacterium]|jgi:ribonuclease Y
MSSNLLLLISFAAGALTGLSILLAIQRTARGRRRAASRDGAAEILARAEKDAQARLQTAALEAKVRLEAAEAKLEEESQRRLLEIEEQKAGVERRDRDLKYRMAYAEEKAAEIQKREAAVAAAEQEASRQRDEAAALVTRQRARLEEVAGYTQQEARQELRNEIELEARRESAATLVRIQEETRERAAEEARWITTQAIQRVPVSQYSESTVTVVTLPSDEMKGRIIGREGRNIRALEMSCGIDLIVDDTPEAIIVSAFDPVRRMVAKLAIEKLVEDGRIHPARIEEVVAKVKEEFDRTMKEEAEAAAFELGMNDVDPKLLKLVGRLGYLTFHGQTLLDHCRETAHIASNMATLLSARVETIRRAAFLHKIGFADEAGKDRSPLILSADIAQRLGEPEAVVHCIQALYGMVAPRTVEAVLLQAAETASSARPGARKEMLEEFLERLRRLEEIARSFAGVKEAYALRAGKEVRVIVEADRVSDKEAVWLSKDIAGRIEKEIAYPGQLRVSVIRETRSVDYAM